MNRTYRYFSIVGLLTCLALLFSGTALADSNGILLTPPLTDISVGYLSNFFGGIGGVLAGPQNTVMGMLFNYFNTGLLAVAGVIVTYTSIYAIITAAASGEPMGKSISHWAVMRTVLGMGLLIPKAGSGYSMMQTFMMWVVLQGVGLADVLWQHTLDYLKQGNVIYTLNSAQQQAGSPEKSISMDYITAATIPPRESVNSEDGYFSSFSVLRSEVCMLALSDALLAKQSAVKKVQADPKTSTVVRLQSQAELNTLPVLPLHYSIVNGFATVPADIKAPSSTSHNAGDQMDYSQLNGICGKFGWTWGPKDSESSDEKQGDVSYMGAKETGLNTVFSSLMPLARKVWDRELNDGKLPNFTCNGGKECKCSPLIGAVCVPGDFAMDDSLNEQAKQNLVTDGMTYQGAVETFKPLKANHFQQRDPSSDPALAFYHDAVSRGWASAGSYYFNLIKMQQDIDKSDDVYDKVWANITLTPPPQSTGATYSESPRRINDSGFNGAYARLIDSWAKLGLDMRRIDPLKDVLSWDLNLHIPVGGYVTVVNQQLEKNYASSDLGNITADRAQTADQQEKQKEAQENIDAVQKEITKFDDAVATCNSSNIPDFGGRDGGKTGCIRTAAAILNHQTFKYLQDQAPWTAIQDEMPQSAIDAFKTAIHEVMDKYFRNYVDSNKMNFYNFLDDIINSTGNIVSPFANVDIKTIMGENIFKTGTDIVYGPLSTAIRTTLSAWRDTMVYSQVPRPIGSKDPIVKINSPIEKLYYFGDTMTNSAIQAWKDMTSVMAFFTKNAYDVQFNAMIGIGAGAATAWIPFVGIAGVAIQKIAEGVAHISAFYYKIIEYGVAVTMPIALAVLGIMFTLGISLSVYVPLIPYVLYTLGVISWMIFVLESMVAAPLAALGLMDPKARGDEVLGKAEASQMLLFAVFLRPATMLIGLIAGTILSYVALALLNATFSSIVSVLWQSSQNKGGDAYSVFNMLKYFAVILVYTTFLSTLMTKCFECIATIPDDIMKWVGAPSQSQGRQDIAMLGKVEQGITDASQKMAHAAGESVSTMGKVATVGEATQEKLGKAALAAGEGVAGVGQKSIEAVKTVAGGRDEGASATKG